MKIRPFHSTLFVFFIIFFTLAYLKYRSFNTLFDLPLYYHAMWNALDGGLLCTTIYMPQGGYCLNLDVWAFTLHLFLPLLYIFNTPATLLFIQSLFLVIGAIPIHWLAKEKFDKIGVIFPVAYLLHPTIWYSNLNDFHLTPLAAGIVSFCFYYCYKREYKKFLLLLLLLINTKVDLALLGIGFGAYIFFVNKDKSKGIALTVGSILWLVLMMKVLIPYLSVGTFDSEQFYKESRYGYLGNGIIAIFENVVTIPKIAYLISIFLPTAFLSLLAPEIFFVISPVLAENLLSTYLWQYLPTTQYSTVLIPLIYMAAVLGVEKVNKRNLIPVLLFFSVISNIGYGPPPQGIIWMLDTPFESSYKQISFTMSERDKLAEDMIKSIPEEASVAATINLIPHIPIRKNIYATSQTNISFLESKVDYVFFDTENYLFRKYDHEPNLLKNVSVSSGFRVMENQSGLILFERPR